MRPHMNRVDIAPGPHQFAFQGYVVDRRRWHVCWQGTPVKFTRKSLNVLLYLIEHLDRVVGKQELLSARWPGQIVEESNLSQQVFLIRKALSLHGSDRKIIETVTGRGYRFAAKLEPVDRQAGPSVPEICREPRRVRRRILNILRACGLSMRTTMRGTRS